MKLICAPVVYMLSFCSIAFFAGCGTSKETVASRSMQNLTAHYNILYNANELLKQTELAMLDAYPDDYAQLLSVYKEPTSATANSQLKNLDSILFKANTIVAEKSQSEYVKDAYFLIARINYLKTNYFNAAEFFTYTYVNYPEERELRQQSLVWKARSLMQLNNLKEAADALDTALKYVETGKKSIAEVYAAEAQFNMTTGNEPNAITMLQKALKEGSSRKNEIRWTYILAQLQERNGLLPQAYQNYTAVVKSNALFEMAFNANINRIRIEDAQSGRSINRIDRLKALLKEDKNKDFLDQIHYRLGDLYMESGEKDKALQQYNASIRSSAKNQNQKGLTYLRLAELFFKDADYVKAKLYYDSTLTNLLPAYPGYDLIRLKSSNLDLLANRYKIIAEEDTLQSLGKLTEQQREVRIEALVREQIKKENGALTAATGAGSAGMDANRPGITDGKFYFDNAAALSLGLTDFRKRWGNRKLEDNWRRSSKSASETTAIAASDAGTTAAAMATNVPSAGLNEAELIAGYRERIPFTLAQLQQSNQKISTAYYDIAGFYKDELKDNAEAVKIYQLLLSRYPTNAYKPAIYYNLYRIYSATDKTKAAEVSDILLSQFPESVYAKAISDPDFAQKANGNTVAITTAYNDAYNLYTQKRYTDVIAHIQKSLVQYGVNTLSAQFAYLNSLAVGRTQKLDAFEQALNQIVSSYPEDKLVTPLVKQHLSYIGYNRELLNKRPVALIDFDPNEPRFITEPTAEPVKQPQQMATVPAQPAIVTNNTTAAAPVNTPPATGPEKTIANTVLAANNLFSLPDSAAYYFIVNVTDPAVNLSSSRFGIGQFNRANFKAGQITHQLKDVNNENQFIYVGVFFSLDAVKEYERNISPLIKDIMKVPAGKYNTFVVTKSVLDKLSDRNLINSYIDFYRQH